MSGYGRYRRTRLCALVPTHSLHGTRQDVGTASTWCIGLYLPRYTPFWRTGGAVPSPWGGDLRPQASATRCQPWLRTPTRMHRGNLEWGRPAPSDVSTGEPSNQLTARASCCAVYGVLGPVVPGTEPSHMAASHILLATRLVRDRGGCLISVCIAVWRCARVHRAATGNPRSGGECPSLLAPKDKPGYSPGIR